MNVDRLPIFRSKEQARILSELFVYASAGLSLAEIARRTGVSPGGVHKEAVRLERSGLVRSERAGRNRLVAANPQSPFYLELRGLLTKAFGPEVLLTQALATVPGVIRAAIYGSWASSETGPMTRAPRDVDVLILGSPEHDRLNAEIDAVEAAIGLPINATVFSPEEWEADDSGFARTVKSEPQIELIG